jgi:hypothetical protein
MTANLIPPWWSSASIIASAYPRGHRRAMTGFAIHGGVDHRNTVRKVAPGLFAQEGRCWRVIYENPVGQSGHCMEPVEWAVEAHQGLEEGVVVVRSARRRVAVG